MKNKDFFVEIDCQQKNKHGNEVCGDCFLSRKIKEEERIVAVLSDGLGSGIKANVLATLTASMALNFTIENQSLHRTATTIMKTLPVDKVRKISYATFSIVDVDCEGETRVVEYDNPAFFLIRNGRISKPDSHEIIIKGKKGKDKQVTATTFNAQKEDRLVFFTDGINQSGIGSRAFPFGWGVKSVGEYIVSLVKEKPFISASHLAKRIVIQAEKNDIGSLRDDASCTVIYFREPRKLLISSGPPYDESKDKLLAEHVRGFQGKKVISGGTTAQILSRELDIPIDVDMSNLTSNLPPKSTMKGIDLVTEGVLTIAAVAERLETADEIRRPTNDPASDIIKLLLNSDEIHFLIGTRVNNAHQDPTLPVELEIRRNVVKKIARILEEKYLKEVHLQFI
jgi:hypothetical protein